MFSEVTAISEKQSPRIKKSVHQISWHKLYRVKTVLWWIKTMKIERNERKTESVRNSVRARDWEIHDTRETLFGFGRRAANCNKYSSLLLLGLLITESRKRKLQNGERSG
jgi:hypothetical protein